ncbi:hypothetical protein ACIPEL_18915 [Streptomyces griseoviridis]
MPDVISARVDGSWTIASRPPSGDVPGLASPPLAWARFFQAVSLAVVQGVPARGHLRRPAGAGRGVATVVLSFLWKKVPGPANKVPAALVAVGVGMAHLDHAYRIQVEEFVTQQRAKEVRVELLMPAPARQRPEQPGGAPRDLEKPESAPLPRKGVPDHRQETAPGPTAEWFYLDTSPLPEAHFMTGRAEVGW